MITAIFFVAAVVALAGAAGIVLFRNPIASVLSLVLVMFALSVLFLLLSAQFLFAVQLIVYAGAVMVLFLFVIALLGPVRELATTRLPRQSALAVVVAVERASPFAISDASRAIQSMILTAWSDGVGSNWAGFGGLDAVGALVGVPAELDVLAVIPFGYPSDPIGRGRKQRKALREIAHRERYGQPFE